MDNIIKLCEWDDAQAAEVVTLDDFYAYMPMHAYLFVPSREMWPASSVNARLTSPGQAKASKWLDRHRAVEQMTWAPGLPALIEDRLIAEGGWIERPGLRCFNLYRPPTISLGKAEKSMPWRDHARKVFGADVHGWRIECSAPPKRSIMH